MSRTALLVCLLFAAASSRGIVDTDVEEKVSQGLKKVGEEFTKGGGKAFRQAQYANRGEKGDKGYEGYHEVEKGAKGSYDKAAEKKAYAEAGGVKKSQNHDDGYYAKADKAEKGEKGYSYAEKGSYSKGHSVKGEHNIHKLDEYKKKTTFFDEDRDEGFKEKHGAYDVKAAGKKGGFRKGDNAKKVFFGAVYGVAGQGEKGGYYFDKAAFDKEAGRDTFFNKLAEFADKGATGAFKRYGYSQGDKD